MTKKKTDTQFTPPAGDFRPLSTGTGIIGWLVRPTEDEPTPCQFVGVLKGVRTSRGGRFGARHYAVFDAIGPQNCQVRIVDKETGELSERDVKENDCIGLDITGGLSALTPEFIGHAVVIAYTGKKIKLTGKKNMWEVNAQVSREKY